MMRQRNHTRTKASLAESGNENIDGLTSPERTRRRCGVDAGLFRACREIGQESDDQLPPDFWRLVEEDRGTPAIRRPRFCPNRLILGFEPLGARRPVSEDLTALASSRRRAIALAVSSIFNSGRWL